jgi:hypothetical protein
MILEMEKSYLLYGVRWVETFAGQELDREKKNERNE